MSSTDTYTRDKRAAMGWIGGILAVLITTAIGFIGARLMAHETAIAVAQDKQMTHEKQLDSINGKLDRILERLK